MRCAGFAVLGLETPLHCSHNTSGTVAGGVLMQDQGDGLQPLAFLSRLLKPTEQRYSVYKQGLATIAYCYRASGATWMDVLVA